MQFVTDRLICRSLMLEEYTLFEAGIEPNWVQEGLSNPHKHLIEGPSPLRHRIARIKTDPNFADIGLVVAFERSTKEMVGSSGFHDWPDENGVIEIGFGIVTEKQNRGIGKELLMGMWREIVNLKEVKVLRYTVSPSNLPSMHIIKGFGFSQVGEQLDPEDGVELIFEMEVSKFKASS